MQVYSMETLVLEFKKVDDGTLQLGLDIARFLESKFQEVPRCNIKQLKFIVSVFTNGAIAVFCAQPLNEMGMKDVKEAIEEYRQIVKNRRMNARKEPVQLQSLHPQSARPNAKQA